MAQSSRFESSPYVTSVDCHSVLDHVPIDTHIGNTITIPIWPQDMLQAILLIHPLGKGEHELLACGGGLHLNLCMSVVEARWYSVKVKD